MGLGSFGVAVRVAVSVGVRVSALGAMAIGAPALAKPWVGTAGKPPSVTTHTMAASIHVTSVAMLERMLVSDRKASLLITDGSAFETSCRMKIDVIMMLSASVSATTLST